MTPSSRSRKKRSLPLVEFHNLCVYIGAKKALSSLSVTISEGEQVAILGPNGAGKSSFIRTLLREFYPIAGDENVIFRMHGKDVWDVSELRSTIGIVSNDLQYTFTRPLTGREVVLSGFFSSVGLFNHAVTPAMERKADGILAFLEMEHLKDRPMTAMSSGESRRLHALHTFRETIRKIARSGTGIILVTHNLHDIVPEISRVVLMKNGRFSGDGPKEEMLTDAKIGDLFHVPLHVREEGGYYYATGY